MRLPYLCIIFVFIFIFTGCEKEAQPSIEYVDVENPTEVVNFMNSLQGNQVIDFYQQISADVKLDIWSNRLSEISHSSSLSREQMKLVKQIQLELSLELFDTKSSINNTFTESREGAKNLTEKTIKVFGVNKARHLFASVKPIDIVLHTQPNTKKKVPIEVNPVDAEECGCSESSDYCGWDPDCTGTCHVEDSDGCGFLLLYNCDGVCV